LKKSSFIIFFSIVFSVYTVVNYYVFIRGLQALQRTPEIMTAYCIIFFILYLSYLASRFLERFHISFISNLLTWIGSFWLGGIVYFFFIVLIIDFIRLLNHFLDFLPPNLYNNYAETKLVTAIFVSSFVILILAAGFINLIKPRIKYLNIRINKFANGLKKLNIAVVSDIHLGTTFGRKRVNKLVDIINKLNPDIVLFAGDVVTEDLLPVLKYNSGENLKNIKSKFGVYGVTGNHEYIGGITNAGKYLTGHNIILLRDEVIMIDNSFYIIGREDLSRKGFTGKNRKGLKDIIENSNKKLPLILLDHQPARINESVENDIDIQFSGHTHHGQLFPFNYITKAVYQISMGYRKIGNTHFYVSSGYGAWGPPLRTSSRSELVFAEITFN
jgi:uncharacterized protein